MNNIQPSSFISCSFFKKKIIFQLYLTGRCFLTLFTQKKHSRRWSSVNWIQRSQHSNLLADLKLIFLTNAYKKVSVKMEVEFLKRFQERSLVSAKYVKNPICWTIVIETATLILEISTPKLFVLLLSLLTKWVYLRKQCNTQVGGWWVAIDEKS